ncbi:MAG: hypothetical protein ACOYXN_00510 [Acidobacteriota bacterium]
MEQTPAETDPSPSPALSDSFLDMTSHLERARAVLSHILESLPNAGDPREKAFAEMGHCAWLITAAEELLDLASQDAGRFEAELLGGGAR